MSPSSVVKAVAAVAVLSSLDSAAAFAHILDADAGVADAGVKHVAAPALDKAWLHPYFRTGLLSKAAERYRLDDFGQAMIDFQNALQILPAHSAERQPARFMLAMSRMNANQWQQASLEFKELAHDYLLLSDYHLYYAALCDLRAGNNSDALVGAGKVSPDAISRAESELVALEALERLEQWDALRTRAQSFLQTFANGPRRAEARFRLGFALEKLHQPADQVINAYRTIWNQAPTELWSKKAEERIAAFLSEQPSAQGERLRLPSAQDWFTRATILHEKQQNVDAEFAYSEAIRLGLPDTALLCQAQFYRAQSVFKQRSRPRAAALYEEAEVTCRKASDTELVVKSLYQGARCQASGGEKPQALASYEKLEKQFPGSSFADDARLRSAELLADKGDSTAARLKLADIPKLYPTGDMAGEALFRLAFAAFSAKDWQGAHRWLDENIRLIPRETMWFAEGRALYWKARVYQLQGENAKSRQMYEQAIRQYPLSFYALLSFERLRESFGKIRQQLVQELHSSQGDEAFPVPFGTSPAYATLPFARAVELARLGLGSDARRQLANLDLEASDETNAQGASLRDRALWLTSVLLDAGRVWNTSHAIPRYTLTQYRHSYPKGADAAAWRLSYPRAYPEYVVTNSKQNNVPAFLQLAIMREESAFAPTIESFANAIGLTQMLVSTAQAYSDELVTRETLLDPASNIMLGSRFLGHLLEHFNRSIPLAIPGYNAGEIAVDRWLSERGNRPLDEFIETIPFDETRGYVKRVLGTYLTYNWLYGSSDPVPRLSFSLKGAQAKPKVAKTPKRKMKR